MRNNLNPQGVLLVAIFCFTLASPHLAFARMIAPKNFFRQADATEIQATASLKRSDYPINSDLSKTSIWEVKFVDHRYIFVRFCHFEEVRFCPTLYFRDKISDETTLGAVRLPGQASLFDLLDSSCDECGLIFYYAFIGPDEESQTVGVSQNGVYLR